ncbi:Tn3 family transposase [Streptomyces globisporus]|uniref:Tn3 family transposase n=1 Tax=Streptomyces globisporus TaxID=1908 RepID=UPI000D1400F4
MSEQLGRPHAPGLGQPCSHQRENDRPGDSRRRLEGTTTDSHQRARHTHGTNEKVSSRSLSCPGLPAGLRLDPRDRELKGPRLLPAHKHAEYIHTTPSTSTSTACSGDRADVIGFDLVEFRFRRLVRVAISAREGAISSAMLLRRLCAGSRKNAVCTVSCEVGRVIRAVQPLRRLSGGLYLGVYDRARPPFRRLLRARARDPSWGGRSAPG